MNSNHTVSYTHLDVYKRQPTQTGDVNLQEEQPEKSKTTEGPILEKIMEMFMKMEEDNKKMDEDRKKENQTTKEENRKERKEDKLALNKKLEELKEGI